VEEVRVIDFGLLNPKWAVGKHRLWMERKMGNIHRIILGPVRIIGYNNEPLVIFMDVLRLAQRGIRSTTLDYQQDIPKYEKASV
jgi:hypothetical protein